ncbi:MAG: NAD-dependent epimerase/dehydratase family protein [Planctomycetia bacterium]|nr:NAD-dependent epimerase/dehydratase family protein [Planctomycetia bacterium]
MSATYLITGGAGNLACQLTHLLAGPGVRLVLFDRADRPVADTAAGCIYVQGDLSQPADIQRIVAEQRPQIVLHLGSLLSGSCEADRQRAWQVNADGGFHVFEAAVAHGVRTLFFPSSLAAYGSPLPDPLPEDFPQWPTGLYGVTKVACERLGIYYHAKHGLDFRCLRLPAVISRFAPRGAASAYSSLAFVDGVQQGSYIFKVNPGTRVSTVYVKDALRAMVELVRAPADRLTRRVYNIHALALSAGEVAEAVRQRWPNADLRFEPDPQVAALIESWPARIVDDSARRDWHWQPSYDLPKLADDMIQELRP